MAAIENKCQIDRGAVIAARDMFSEVHAKISGRSGEYNTITEPVGFSFTELIAEEIRCEVGSNKEAWSSAMLACTHAFGVLDKINSDVKVYDDKIEELQTDLNAIVNGPDKEDAGVVTAAIEWHTGEAEAAWAKLKADCTESEGILSDGPTPESILALAEGGYLGKHGQIGYYTTDDLDYFFVDATDAETIAIHLENAVLHGYDGSIEALEDHPEYLALIANIVNRGLTAQQNGDELRDGELEFLETLFGELEGIDPNNPGFLGFVDAVENSENIDDSLRAEISESLSNAMLVLSSEEVGGGMNLLPGDVISVANGSNVKPVGPVDEHDPDSNEMQSPDVLWLQSFKTLGGFLENSSSEVSGGVEFSVSLLASSAMEVERGYSPAPFRDEALQGIIEVATRNPEAGNVVITGEDFDGETYDHHVNHENIAPDLLEVFYSHDWGDGGQAVSGLTDWIWESQNQGSEVERAGNAAYELIKTLTDDETFRDTESTGEGDYSLAVTEINPRIAESLASIYVAYLDDFSISDENVGYRELEGNRNDLFLFHENGDHALVLSSEMKQDFIQLLVANEDLAPNVIASTEAQERKIIEAFLTHPDIGNSVGGRAASDLRTILDSALIQEYSDRKLENDEARERANQQWQAGYNVFTAISVGVAGDNLTPAGIGTEVLIKLLEQPMKDYVGDLIDENKEFSYIENLEQRFLESDAELRDHANLQILSTMLDLGMVDIEVLRAEGLLVEDVDGNERLPMSPGEWGEGDDGYISAVEELVGSVDVPYPGRADNYVRDFMENYHPDLYETRLK
ncbi:MULTISPECIES: hypothetical protein [unclassified Nocardiopsis]|uniref:TPR repeat region-containing protein n=1 Tax=Nocardiopsis TaxID=2013 RepID=UPI00387AEBBE